MVSMRLRACLSELFVIVDSLASMFYCISIHKSGALRSFTIMMINLQLTFLLLTKHIFVTIISFGIQNRRCTTFAALCS